MKNFIIATALSTALIIPSVASASTLFPDLTFPNTWTTKSEQPLVGQNKTAKPVLLPASTDE